MNGEPSAELERACRTLITVNETLLRWSWDDRFGGAIATVAANQAAAALEALGVFMPARWDHASVPGAPATVQDRVNAIGGIRPGQWILSTDPTRDVLVVGAWWPWGNAQTFSIRLFPVASGAARPTQGALATAFRAWFCP